MPNTRFWLQSILENISHIRSFMAGMDRESFQRDSKTVFAIKAVLMEISEASRHLPREMIERHPDFLWKEIRGLRNVFAHEYFRIDLDQVWKTIKIRVGPLETAIQAELDRLDNE
ncbi:DUF86 domain-containing protein [Ferrovibrio sp.]|uniref:HepT-like ribonuclease domain-containing protein n=1 Tax=Ferrovibrio sp. TaxID=1917215 RepID=UPI0035B1C1D3